MSKETCSSALNSPGMVVFYIEAFARCAVSGSLNCMLLETLFNLQAAHDCTSLSEQDAACGHVGPNLTSLKDIAIQVTSVKE